MQLQGKRDKTEETLYIAVDSSSSFLEVPQLFLCGCPGPWSLLEGSLWWAGQLSGWALVALPWGGCLCVAQDLGLGAQ